MGCGSFCHYGLCFCGLSYLWIVIRVVCGLCFVDQVIFGLWFVLFVD